MTSQPINGQTVSTTCDERGLLLHLENWRRGQKNDENDFRHHPLHDNNLSAVKQVLRIKDEIRAIERVEKSLRTVLAEIPDLILAKQKKMRGAFDQMSPLLRLQDLDQFSNVIGYLDEEALYFAEEASVSVKDSAAAREQWNFLDRRRTLGRANDRVVEDVAERGRAYGYGNWFSRRMEALAPSSSRHFCDDDYHRHDDDDCDSSSIEPHRDGPEQQEEDRERRVLVDCRNRQQQQQQQQRRRRRCCETDEFSFDMAKVIRNVGHYGSVFVRMSLHNHNAAAATGITSGSGGSSSCGGSVGGDHHLVWNGFWGAASLAMHQGIGISYVSHVLDWPELRRYRQWANQFNDEPWRDVLAREEFETRMKSLLENFRVTITKGPSLLIAAGGYQDASIGDGWVRLRLRGTDATNTTTKQHAGVAGASASAGGTTEQQLGGNCGSHRWISVALRVGLDGLLRLNIRRFKA